jgi:uncharacterized protein YjbJ (UPF0337 family)
VAAANAGQKIAGAQDRRNRRIIMTFGKTIAHQTEATKGAVKKFVGRATGNPRLRTEGRFDQAKGNAKQSGAKFKNIFKH